MNFPSDTFVHGYSMVLSVFFFAVAIIAKQLTEQSRRQLVVVGPGSYVYETRRYYGWKQRVAQSVYRVTFSARIILALLLPILPEVVGVILAVSYVAEMYVLFRYHLVLFAALSLMLAITSLADNAWLIGIATHDFAIQEQYFAPAVAFIQVLVVAMYGLSSVRKIRNGFLSGRVIEYGILISLSKRRYKDHLFGSAFVLRTVIARLNPRVVAWAVVVFEIVIAAMLVVPIPVLTVVGIALAALSQIGFTVLFPRTLLPFTLAVLSALCLWI